LAVVAQIGTCLAVWSGWMVIRRGILACAAVLWMAAVGAGFTYLSRYSVEPGTPASAPDEWPHDSRLPAPRGKYQLVMTIHPHCPCSRASVTELNNLMALLRRNQVKGYVLVVKPADLPDAWIDTEAYRRAGRIPGIDVMVDVDGKEAARLGAATSGQVLLYGPDARLRFAGGITPDRGHLGDSPGRQRILSLVRNGTTDATDSLVFGCDLDAKVCTRHPHPENEGL
jgi:hypothetical protein